MRGRAQEERESNFTFRNSPSGCLIGNLDLESNEKVLNDSELALLQELKF